MNSCYRKLIAQLSLELSSKFLSQLDESKSKRLSFMLDEIRTEINKNRHCMLRDGAAILPLCIVPCYGDGEQIGDNDEFAHKAPVLLDCFYENYKFEWDLTTKRVSKSKIKLKIEFTRIILH